MICLLGWGVVLFVLWLLILGLILGGVFFLSEGCLWGCVRGCLFRYEMGLLW